MNTNITIEKVNAAEFGLDETKAQEVESVFLPVIAERENLMGDYLKIVEQHIAPELIAPARELRLKLVTVRTNTDRIHKTAKAFYLAGGRFIDAWKNKNVTVIELMESNLRAIENYYIEFEKKKAAELKVQRIAILATVCDNPALYQVELMTEEAFSNLVEGQKLIKQQREQLAIKVEQERMAAIEAERAERERIRVENEALKQAQIDREKEIEAERLKQQKELEAERAEAAKKQKEIEDAARIEREKAEAERLKLESELQSKRDAELKAASEANRIERDRLLNEAKAAKAPDKDKLKAFVTAITLPVFPDLKSEESKATAEVIRQKFEAFKAWAVTQIESI